MRVIVGIGNPESSYINNRHNAGFLFLDYFASRFSISFIPSKGDYYFCQGKIDTSEFILIKPTTYVNNSGIAALQVAEKYKINPDDILVVHDDLDLDFSTFKIKKQGGFGGHNGVNSIIYHLKNENFPRIRIGIGNNFEKGLMADYVLSDFDDSELPELPTIFKNISVLVDEFIIGGMKSMFNKHSKLMNEKNNSKSKDINNEQ